MWTGVPTVLALGNIRSQSEQTMPTSLDGFCERAASFACMKRQRPFLNPKSWAGSLHCVLFPDCNVLLSLSGCCFFKGQDLFLESVAVKVVTAASIVTAPSGLASAKTAQIRCDVLESCNDIYCSGCRSARGRFAEGS